MTRKNNSGLIGYGLVAALFVAAFALVPNILSQDKMPWLIAIVLAVAFSAAVIVYVLNITIVKVARHHLLAVRQKCEAVLDNISAEHVSAILNNSVIGDAELDRLEKAPETKEVWILTSGNLEYDVPGRVFFDTIHFNLDTRGIKYTYFIQDNDEVRHNVAKISSRIKNKDNMRFIVMPDFEWDQLPIAGIPVTIHNPDDDNSLRIYIATQDHEGRGSYWSVFHGWTVARIIGRVRAAKRRLNAVTMPQFLESEQRPR
jgi:hypothetical protein